MGKPERKIRERIRSSSSYFLRCFGISRKIHSDKTTTVETAQEKKKKKKTRSHWFSRSIKFRLKTAGEITPAPIYEKEKHNSTVEDDNTQKLFQVIRHVTDQKNIITSSDYKTVEQTSNEKFTNEQRDINPDPLSLSGGYETSCHKDVLTTFHGRGKPDPTKTDETGLKPKSSRVRRRLRRLDSVIGISIIMLTLIIMLMWGRLCAIICTSTWCYFLPRIKEAATAAKRKRSGAGKAEGGLFPVDLDLNSEAYKKKVVLDGFLVRQHRVSF